MITIQYENILIGAICIKGTELLNDRGTLFLRKLYLKNFKQKNFKVIKLNLKEIREAKTFS